MSAAGPPADAEQMARAAIEANPDDVQALEYLGLLEDQRGAPDKAVPYFRRLFALHPDNAFANYNLAMMLDTSGAHDEAPVYFRGTLALDPLFAEGHVGLAKSLLLHGDYANGFQELEWRFSALTQLGYFRHSYREFDRRPGVTQAAIVHASVKQNGAYRRSRPWLGQDLNDEAVVIKHDAGYGDTIMFSRYAAMIEARDGRAVMAVPRELQRLMKTAHGVSEVISNQDELQSPHQVCLVTSLPFIFATTLDTIPNAVPYLHSDSTPWVDFLKQLPGLKVGIVWAGREYGSIDAANAQRSMKLTQLLPLLSVSGCSFVSLQLGPPAAELRDLADDRIHDVSDRLRDWADTAGLIVGLDVVVSVDTAVCHLAGALGKRVFMLNRFASEWRWGRDRRDSPWYKSMTIYRQRTFGDWAPVVADVCRDLSTLVAKNTNDRY